MGEFIDSARRRRAEPESLRKSGRPMSEPVAPAPIESLIVQAKLSVGPAGDRYEQEADAVADNVVASLNATASSDATEPEPRPESRVQRATSTDALPVVDVQRAADVGLGGGDLDQDTSSRIQAARGGGTAMPTPLRSKMERAFNADFGSVRVHEGARSADLNNRIQAKAFTVGNDIFFRDKIPNASSPSGQHLVAHELTHTIQQGASSQRPIQRQAISDNLVPPIVREHRPASQVQAKFGAKFKKFKKKVATLFGKASKSDVKDTEIESPVLDEASHDETMMHARQTKGSGPGENPDYSNTKLWGEQPDEYRVTIAAAQDRPDWMTDVKALKKAALRNPSVLMKAIKGADVEVPDPNGTGTITKKPQDVLTSIALESTEAERKKQGLAERTLKEFTDGIHEVGHTWVRLDKLVEGQVQERYSYGMWPQKVYDPESDSNAGGYAGFIDAGPGEIRHPDTEHEGDTLTAYQDYKVGRSKFDKAHKLAIKRYNNPPPYVLTGYNCTAFAREIVKTAGGSYPGSGLLPGFGYTPGNLYAQILAKTEKNRRGARAGGNEADDAITDRIDARHQTWKKAGRDAADTKHFALTGRAAKRSAPKVAARLVGIDYTIDVWDGSGPTAPTAGQAPDERRLWTGSERFVLTGTEDGDFAEATDTVTGEFVWLWKTEYEAGGTPDIDEPAPAVSPVSVPWTEIMERLEDRGYGDLGIDLVYQVTSGGDPVSNADIRTALLTDTDERAAQLAEYIAGSRGDADEVLDYWGPAG